MQAATAIDTTSYVGIAERMPFDSNLEAIETYAELERRRELVSAGKSRLLSEGEAYEALCAAGCHV